MLLRLERVLTPDQLQGARALLAHLPFADGRLSAGAAAARVKNNQEADRNARGVAQLDDLVMGALIRHPGYRAGALPLRVAAPFYSRYEPGMRYGDHVDDPIMGADGVPYRTDVSITIFLNEPADYDGGELVVHTSFGENRVKLPAGDGVLYPSSSRHHVAEVTRGRRLAAVTWVQSLVRDPARRELLYGLNLAREKLLLAAPDADETAQVNTAYVNLVRMWSDL
jgi:PKHD-type hydroxylase